MLDVSSKVVVITGASRGLGRGLAEELARRGAKLGLCARTAIVGVEGVARELDVTDEAAVMEFAAAVASAHGPIDLWINNAGVLDPVVFVRALGTDALMRHLAINVAGVLHGTKAFVHHLRATGREGVLINISSGAALKGYAGWGAYCAGKAAVDRLTECVALEEGAALRAYSVAPGVIDTDMQAQIRGMSEAEFPEREKFVQLKRDEAFNTPAFVARELSTIAFGASPPPSGAVLRLPSERRA